MPVMIFGQLLLAVSFYAGHTKDLSPAQFQGNIVEGMALLFPGQRDGLQRQQRLLSRRSVHIVALIEAPGRSCAGIQLIGLGLGRDQLGHLLPVPQNGDPVADGHDLTHAVGEMMMP